MKENNKVILEVKDVKKYFPVKTGLFGKSLNIKAVDGFNTSLVH